MVKYSVIIPTFNRAEQLKRCLKSVCQQSISASEYEIIVADDGSTDNTAGVVRDLATTNQDYLIRYLHQENAGCGSARNLGIRNAHGEILFFTDDDCIVPENWMAELLKGFETHPETAGVGGWYAFSEEELRRNPYARTFHLTEKSFYRNYEEYSVFGNELIGPAGNTANMAYRRQAFETVGLFDTYTKKTAHIDWEFKIRINYSGLPLLYIPLIIRHTKKMDLREFVAKSFRYGMADYYLSTRFDGYNDSVYFLRFRGYNNFFFLLSYIKNIDSSFSWGVYVGFLFLRWVGAKYAIFQRLRSTNRFSLSATKRYSRTEHVNGRSQYFCIYTSLDYSLARGFASARIQAHDLLNEKRLQPIISIIIPFYNRADYVTPGFISGINHLQADTSVVEILLVDDGSTDDTLTALREIVKLIKFKTTIITQPNGGPASARNAGIRQSVGDYIFFTDSDVQLPQYWLSELLTPFFFDQRIALTGGGQINPHPETRFDTWRNHRAPKPIFTITDERGLPPIDTANMCVKKSALEDTSLLFFDESYKVPGYEDFDYAFRIKESGRLTAKVPRFVENVRSLNLVSFAQMCIARSRGYAVFKKKYGSRLTENPLVFDYSSLYGNRYKSLGNALTLLFAKDRLENAMHIALSNATYTPENHPWMMQLLRFIASSEQRNPQVTTRLKQ